MVKILREAGLCAKKHGVSDVTIYAWRKRLGQLEPADVKPLRQRGQENAKVGKRLAPGEGRQVRSASSRCSQVRAYV